jgi:hypothetical protein
MATATDMLRSGLNLMRRLPPRDVRTNLSGLTGVWSALDCRLQWIAGFSGMRSLDLPRLPFAVLRPELTEEFLQRVDQPLQTRVDSVTKRRYILCDYNRDGDSYRSPWSNKYEPAIPAEDGEGFVPSAGLRELEISANEIFDAYREQYFEVRGMRGATLPCGLPSATSPSLPCIAPQAANSISSVYMWDLDKGFASCWLIKKGACARLGSVHCTAWTRYLLLPAAEIGSGRFLKSGCWDSVHVIEVTPDAATGKSTYKLTTTVMLSLQVRTCARTCSSAMPHSRPPHASPLHCPPLCAQVDRPETVGAMDLSGSLTRQATQVRSLWGVEAGHGPLGQPHRLPLYTLLLHLLLPRCRLRSSQ